MHGRLARWSTWSACDLGEAAEGLELWHRWSAYDVGHMSQLIPQPFRHFTYVTAHFTALPLLHLHHRHFTYVTMPLWWCLIYPWWFCNLQWLQPAALYERCKLALELKRLKTPDLNQLTFSFKFDIYGPLANISSLPPVSLKLRAVNIEVKCD